MVIGGGGGWGDPTAASGRIVVRRHVNSGEVEVGDANSRGGRWRQQHGVLADGSHRRREAGVASRGVG